MGMNNYFSVANPQNYVYYVPFYVTKSSLHIFNILYSESSDSK